ncbi:wall-associated receptor kinase-like 14 [Zingiber officinale]|uniref:wall-associated receptor kinase-like 14 n=1 Tax=Zingiber officinale TaxID=94328 RepID=UPI001C4D9C54|nr:wall-associated receptor kinase-like 14 [Zingiber officinale]
MVPSLLFALLLLAAAAPAIAVESTRCDRTCGSTTVLYPFGFSAGCQIRLNCSASGEVRLGTYFVRNVTASSLIVDVSASCNRSIKDAAVLFSDRLSMAASNALFLRNCTGSEGQECSIDTEIISKRLNQTSCGRTDDDIRCYSSGRTEGFYSKKNFTEMAKRCKFLFTSLRYGRDAFNQSTLVFESAEVGWWLQGDCRCAANASCSRIDFPSGNGTTGYRCSCNEGFTGDGYADGGGCGRASKCSSEHPCRKGINVGVIMGGIAAGSFLALGVAVLCYRFFFRGDKASETEEAVAQRLLLSGAASGTVAIYSHKDIERATGNFSDAYRLGSGAYGTVYRGRFSADGGFVAIKRLKNPDTDNVMQVINEIKLVSSVSHPNLVHLLGCCIGRGHHILVYEFVPNGTLSQHLHRELGDVLPWPARVVIAAETARAIAYLHTAVRPPIYHRDIKSSNILLDYSLRPKLADFGLSRAVAAEWSHISTAPQGTPGYVDPQYHQNFHLSDKSDVYSFGVVLVEMITAMKAVDFRRDPSEVNLAALAADRIAKGQVEEIVDPVVKENCHGRGMESVMKVAELAFRCLAFHKEARPAMTEVAEELERIRAEEGGASEVKEEEGKEMALPFLCVKEPWGSEQSCSSSSSLSNASSSGILHR